LTTQLDYLLKTFLTNCERASSPAKKRSSCEQVKTLPAIFSARHNMTQHDFSALDNMTQYNFSEWHNKTQYDFSEWFSMTQRRRRDTRQSDNTLLRS